MIIVNFATSAYQSGQQRLARSIRGYQVLLFDKYQAIGSPSHQESPYEFKIHAIEKAFERDNIVLWCDASMYCVGDLSIIENIIKQDGYFMSEAGHYVRDWCKPETLQYFGITKETDFIMFSAGFLGLDKTNGTAMEWFAKWKQSALDGHFKGDWSNHRHDMTCGSIIAQQMGMKFQRGGQHMSYIGPGYSTPEPNSVFHLQGML
ncbi:MAG: hypothetical protein ABUT20_45960 [Bacteroidota bacterium]